MISTAPLFQFTRYLQDLDSLSLSIYTVFTGSQQPLFFNLHGIYRISTAPLFQFTRYLQDFDSPSFSIYTVFTGSRQPTFFQFTYYLQPPLINLHVFYRIFDSLPLQIYMLFT